MKRSVINRVAQLIIIITLPIVIMLGSARLVMNPSFLNWEYQRAGFPQDRYGFTTQDRLDYGHYGISYILNSEPLSYLADRTLPPDKCFPQQDTACAMFNDKELSHMHDVQVVANTLFKFGLLAFALLLLSAIILVTNRKRQKLASALKQGVILLALLVITSLSLAIAAWDVFFARFHQLFFADGTWQFFYSDTLIRLYPEQFWFDASIAVGMITVATSVITYLVAQRLSPRMTNTSKI